MPWCASVSSCSRHKSCNRQQGQDQCVGMVESRRKASDASGAAGSQQGCSDKRTPGKDMWVRSRRRAKSRTKKMQGNQSTSLSPLSEQNGEKGGEYLPLTASFFLSLG